MKQDGKFNEYTPAQYQAALDDLERRGVICVSYNKDGEKLYQFPDAETGRRLLRESHRARGQHSQTESGSDTPVLPTPDEKDRS